MVVVALAAAVLGAGVSFAQEPQTPSVVTTPNWISKPTGEDVDRLYPRRARKEAISGIATISCGVDVKGLLVQCQVVQEEPRDFGFGEAALQMVPRFRMSATTSDGHSVEGGQVRIPLTFRDTGGRFLLQDLTWARAPSAAEAAAAFPATAGGTPTGEAVLRCRLTRSGQPAGCKVQSETPAGMGIGKAALALADAFQLAIGPDDAAKMSTVLVELPVRLHNPSTPPPPPAVTDLLWRTTLPADASTRLYPPQARSGGVDSGLATVDCAVGAEGKLSDCKVVSEAPAAQGFGAAVLSATELMQLSPWTKRGDALAGRRVTLPIRLRQVAAEAPKS